MEIQRFADVYDEMLADAKKNQAAVQQQMNDLAVEKQNALNTYETNYQNQLSDYNNLVNEQQNYINTWADTAKEQQQKQTDYNIGLINQNKEEAAKQTNAEVGNAYIDYQKGLNQFGGSAEQIASSGLGGTGFAKNQEIAMNITYQNRVSAAKSALQKANADYDNQIQQALLNNDAALAEIALQQMQQSYQLALQGFEYRNTLYNNRMNYIQSLNDSYFTKGNTLQSRLDQYNSNIYSIKAAQQEAAQAARSGNSGGSGGSKTGISIDGYGDGAKNNAATGFANSPSKLKETTYYNKYQKGEIAYNKDALTNGKVDKNKVFSNGYQPNNVNGNKLSETRYKVSDLLGNGGTVENKAGANISNQKVWAAKNRYYVWDGSQNKYIDITDQL